MDRRTFLKVGAGAVGGSLASKVGFAEGQGRKFELEVIASCLDDAKAAHAGGATRLEVAVNLQEGGFTPPIELVKRVVEEVPIAARIMIRERPGVVLSGSAELRGLVEKERAVTHYRINGLVLGYVKNGEIDMPTIRALIAAEPSAHYTIHNAIEFTRDPVETLKKLTIFPQVDLALVGGRRFSHPETPLAQRIAHLKAYKAVWDNGKRLLLVNGMKVDEIKQIQREAGVREFHVGEQVRTPARPYPWGKVDAKKVRAVVELLARP